MFRSTKTSDRKAACKLCFAWENAATLARRKELTAAQARKVIAEMVAISSGETLSFHTARGWLGEWLEGKAGVVSERTRERYRQVVADFLVHLGARASAPLASISPGDIISFRNKLRGEGRAVDTVNVVKGMLSVPFEAARRQGLIPLNPASAVDALKDAASTSQTLPASHSPHWLPWRFVSSSCSVPTRSAPAPPAHK